MAIKKVKQSQRENHPDNLVSPSTENIHLNRLRLGHGGNNLDNSALLTTLLELLKEKESALFSPALMRLEARRKGSRH
jgi:hypothetical protein